MVNQLFVFFFVLFKLLFGLFAIGHIANDAPKTDSLAILIPYQGNRRIDLPFRTVYCGNLPIKPFGGPAGFVYTIKCLKHFFCIFGIHEVSVVHACHCRTRKTN